MPKKKSQGESLDIGKLIEEVEQGHNVSTGVNIYNSKGVLLLNRDTEIQSERPLRVIERCGTPEGKSAEGVELYGWGNPSASAPMWPSYPGVSPDPDLAERLQEISELKEEARRVCSTAKDAARQINEQILQTGGSFDVEVAEETVTELVRFMDKNERAFLYLSHEIASYDEYLYNHSVHVCVLGTAILKRLNKQFTREIHQLRWSRQSEWDAHEKPDNNRLFYSPGEVFDFSLACFLHDIGKLSVSKEVLDKPGALTTEEQEEMRRHSDEYGLELIRKNGLDRPIIENTVRYHHAALYAGEANCYPRIDPEKIPPYTGVAKLADMYDAMTSRRCYKEALNPGLVVAKIFRRYADKNQLLRYLVHSFVNVVGLYPTGSFLYLKDGRLVYVLDSAGPIVQPLTDEKGQPLEQPFEPFNLRIDSPDHPPVDRDHPFETPADAFHLIPVDLRTRPD